MPTVGGVDPVTIGLPSSSASSTPVTASNGTVVYADAAASTDVAVQSLEGGARVQTVLQGRDAPSRFTYALSDRVIPTVEDDGSVFLARADASSGSASVAAAVVEAPWAVDAAGK
ncbi:hypothetical protein, partial [Paraburkholderia sp. BR14264]|uniref:hypothetical protein n=1 Tax=Paraburkholderia sp. BR14264 TaxID=3237001 RepID=UPI003978160B